MSDIETLKSQEKIYTDLIAKYKSDWSLLDAATKLTLDESVYTMLDNQKKSLDNYAFMMIEELTKLQREIDILVSNQLIAEAHVGLIAKLPNLYLKIFPSGESRIQVYLLYQEEDTDGRITPQQINRIYGIFLSEKSANLVNAQHGMSLSVEKFYLDELKEFHPNMR